MTGDHKARPPPLRLSPRDKQLIAEMCEIALLGERGAGDYQGWSDADYTLIKRLLEKLEAKTFSGKKEEKRP